jgi:hypothetical protein
MEIWLCFSSGSHAGFGTSWSKFNARVVHRGSDVDKLALRQVSFPKRHFSLRQQSNNSTCVIIGV